RSLRRPEEGGGRRRPGHRGEVFQAALRPGPPAGRPAPGGPRRICGIGVLSDGIKTQGISALPMFLAGASSAAGAAARGRNLLPPRKKYHGSPQKPAFVGLILLSTPSWCAP